MMSFKALGIKKTMLLEENYSSINNPNSLLKNSSQTQAQMVNKKKLSGQIGQGKLENQGVMLGMSQIYEQQQQQQQLQSQQQQQFSMNGTNVNNQQLQQPKQSQMIYQDKQIPFQQLNDEKRSKSSGLNNKNIPKTVKQSQQLSPILNSSQYDDQSRIKLSSQQQQQFDHNQNSQQQQPQQQQQQLSYQQNSNQMNHHQSQPIGLKINLYSQNVGQFLGNNGSLSKTTSQNIFHRKSNSTQLNKNYLDQQNNNNPNYIGDPSHPNNLINGNNLNNNQNGNISTKSKIKMGNYQSMNYPSPSYQIDSNRIPSKNINIAQSSANIPIRLQKNGPSNLDQNSHSEANSPQMSATSKLFGQSFSSANQNLQQGESTDNQIGNQQKFPNLTSNNSNVSKPYHHRVNSDKVYKQIHQNIKNQINMKQKPIENNLVHSNTNQYEYSRNSEGGEINKNRDSGNQLKLSILQQSQQQQQQNQQYQLLDYSQIQYLQRQIAAGGGGGKTVYENNDPEEVATNHSNGSPANKSNSNQQYSGNKEDQSQRLQHTINNSGVFNKSSPTHSFRAQGGGSSKLYSPEQLTTFSSKMESNKLPYQVQFNNYQQQNISQNVSLQHSTMNNPLNQHQNSTSPNSSNPTLQIKLSQSGNILLYGNKQKKSLSSNSSPHQNQQLSSQQQQQQDSQNNQQQQQQQLLQSSLLQTHDLSRKPLLISQTTQILNGQSTASQSNVQTLNNNLVYPNNHNPGNSPNSLNNHNNAYSIQQKHLNHSSSKQDQQQNTSKGSQQNQNNQEGITNDSGNNFRKQKENTSSIYQQQGQLSLTQSQQFISHKKSSSIPVYQSTIYNSGNTMNQQLNKNGQKSLNSSVATIQAEISYISLYSVKSKAGSLPNKPIKTNQDSYIVFPHFCNNKNKYIFSVCDGHGSNGHLVSQFLKKKLPLHIETMLKVKGNDYDINSVKACLNSAFQKTSQELKDSTIDSQFSGSTCVLLYINQNRIWCANLGDSRAICGKISKSEWEAVSLSIDQKPDNEKEKQRIIANGGRVEPYRDCYGNPLGPYRVWLKSENMPGLAMSRSFGDEIAQSVGVISEPEINCYEISEDDKFLVIASDGVWEFLTNEKVLSLVTPYYMKNDPEGACDRLIKESTALWKKEDEVVDDITAIVVFFNKHQVETGNRSSLHESAFLASLKRASMKQDSTYQTQNNDHS